MTEVHRYPDGYVLKLDRMQDLLVFSPHGNLIGRCPASEFDDGPRSVEARLWGQNIVSLYQAKLKEWGCHE